MTAPLPKISLVTPSLNQGTFIRATIESVLSQEYPNLEYRIQDGGSTDGTLAVLREYEGRVPFVSEEDEGQADAINRGLSRVSGDVLGYLNSDDVLRPGALSAVGAAFASDPDLDLVWGGAAYVDADGDAVSSYLVRPDAFARLADACFVAQPAAFFRRRLWERVGSFDVDLHHTMDYDYWLRIAACTSPARMRFLDQELAACRMHADAKTVAGWSRALDEIMDLVKRRVGYVSLWWCVAKWDHLTDGRSQASDPHPVPWRAYPPAIAEFIRRNPRRPGTWWRGLRGVFSGLSRRARTRLSGHGAIAGLALLLAVLGGAAADAPAAESRSMAIAGARGDWPQWRGNPQHTGYQALPGRMTHPAVKWREYLGGSLIPSQVHLQAAVSPGDRGSLVVAAGGDLRLITASGETLWTRRSPGNLRILGTWDFVGNGARQILAASAGLASTRLFLFDEATGERTWTSPSVAGQAGGVKVARLKPGKGLQIVWLPAASSTIRAWDFSGGVRRARLMWETRLEGFVTDPYGFSALAVTTWAGAGRRVVIAGGRHRMPVIFVDGATGREVERRDYRRRAKGVEWGGERQLLQVADVDGKGHEQIVSISDHLLADGEMFHGIVVTRAKGQGADSVFDTHPEGLHFAAGSVRETEGKTAFAVLSRYDRAKRQHELLALDLATGTKSATFPDFRLTAIVPEAAGTLLVLGRAGPDVEQPVFEGRLAALRYDGRSFREVWEAPAALALAGRTARDVGVEGADNEGMQAVTLPLDGGGRAVLAVRGDRPDNCPELLALDLATGDPVANLVGRDGTRLDLLDSLAGPDPASSRVVLSDNSGSLLLLDGRLDVVRELKAGDFRQNVLNGHSTEIAVVADLAGGGHRDIVAIDSLNRVRRVALSREGCPSETPGTLWNSNVGQDLVAFPNGRGGRWLALADVEGNRPSVNVVDDAGVLRWKHVFGGEGGSPPEDVVPAGFNTGRFGPAGESGIVCSGGSSKVFPRRTYAFDGATGRLVWNSPVGSYWDATLALADVDGDGVDDVLVNADTYKCRVVSGRDGSLLVDAALLPVYRHLAHVDYNGALVVVGQRGRELQVVDAEDDAHLALFGVPLRPGPGERTRVLWASPQAGLDEERRSMAALAPDASGGWLVGVGSKSGVVRVLRGSDGKLLWRAGLRDGRVLRAAPAEPNSLSSVLALDVDGDGRVEFVAGGADGWIYALDAEAGKLIWSLDLGSPVGDPIAAELESGGGVEILVPTVDGFLNAIGPR